MPSKLTEYQEQVISRRKTVSEKSNLSAKNTKLGQQRRRIEDIE
jgi:hypothetical protein